MELNHWIIVMLIVLLIVTRFLPVKGITNITIQEVKEKLSKNNIQFIDVRTPGEYRRNHQVPFQNIPLYELTSRTNELNKSLEIVVICQSGIRSSKASRVLKKRGFNQISNVKGGMSAWNKSEPKKMTAE
ncbi:rhodanese-like domain-containing protein [Ornithinibacillus xuwenensis]|uniref:Rhodanese-like domain-containing protein n=1 Tax=Ornithinibacillus xuwenensis TaxID=3144668 RepID=A0ABU9XJH5_9BACI